MAPIFLCALSGGQYNGYFFLPLQKSFLMMGAYLNIFQYRDMHPTPCVQLYPLSVR